MKNRGSELPFIFTGCEMWLTHSWLALDSLLSSRTSTAGL